MRQGQQFTVFLFPLALFLFLACQPPKQVTQELVDWVPQNTTMVVQVNDFNGMENALLNNAVAKNIPSTLPLFVEKLKAFPSKNKEPQLLCVSDYGKKEKGLSVMYRAAIDSSYFDQQQIEYSGARIFVEKKGKTTLYTTFINGFTLHADTKIILENSIRNYQQNAQGVNDKGFYRIVKTADSQAPMNVFLLGKEATTLSQGFGALPLFPKVGQQWSSFDVYPTAQTLELDGLVRVVDSLGDPVGILHENQPQKSQLIQAIPEETTSFLSVTADNLPALEKSFKKWILYHNQPLLSSDLNRLSSVDEFGILRLEKENALVFHLRNETEAATIFIPENQPKQYRKQAYYSSALPRELKILIGVLGEDVAAQWVAKIDDFLFFAESEKSLKFIIAAYTEGKTLANNNSFQRFYDEILTDRFSLLWVAQTEKIAKQLETNAFWKGVAKEKLPYIGLQGIVEDAFLHLHLRFHQAQEKQAEKTATNVTLLSLEHPLATAPQWLINHRSKEKDIVVQDRENNLYLFSNTGKLFWKKKLPGKVQGAIQQVDLYKNGRLQMAFRTEGRFMILDRNGQVVPPFNMKIPSTTPIQPLAVFDYDLLRDYRFLVSQGNRLQMYNNKGKIVNGFTFKQTKSNLSEPPNHIRIDKKDFIVVKEENGELHLLNRLGKPRVQIKTKSNYSDQAIYSYLKTFTTTDIDGNLVQIDTKGNVITTPLGLDKDHEITTTTKSLVSLSENILTIKGIPVTLPYGSYTPPKIFYLNNVIYVSVTDRETEKVYLFYSNGTAVSGFPVYGNSAIDMVNADKDNALELVVQSETNDILVYEIK